MIPDSVKKYVYYEEPGIVLLHGDCLEILPMLEPDSIDLVLTDPPYSSGARQTNQLRARKGMLRSEKFAQEWFGTDNASSYGFMFFMRGVMVALMQALKVGGHSYYFIDWRNYPLLFGVAETAGLRVNNMLVWDKEIFGMGRGFRNQHELAIHASKGSPRECNRHDLANVMRSKRVRQDKHPTEKPLELIVQMAEMSSSDNDTIIDPFLGSGTTAVAAKQLGRKCIGIELEKKYLDIAIERLKQEILI